MIRGASISIFHPIGFARLQLWLGLQLAKVFTLIVGLIGILSYLVLSTGWRDPFQQVSWFGVQAPGWLFDLVYARANNIPSGAHIISYLLVAIFGVQMWLLTINTKSKNKSITDYIGDPFFGVAGLVFLGGLHELPWITTYYLGYYQYLNWSLLTEVLRDVSFVVCMVLFIVIFAKYPNRKVPFRIFQTPVLIYASFLVGWFFLPSIFGFHVLPISTLNNTNFGQGLYQQTPWFTWLWVNALEVASWVLLFGCCEIQLLRWWSNARKSQ